ncbi:c-type cytochrome [Orrella marina]|uniref:Cytochrome C n=1 Tax=Orrella marina TaxID=2163011 RepID=A0A2R4XKQ6_9BURK|nr:cytochrome C [Orrella marina]
MHLMSERRVKSVVLAVVGIVGVVLSVPVALAEALSMEEGTALAKSSACLACHQIDSRRVGPSFKQISERYAGQSDAVEILVDSVRKGGRGKWGAIPMPAQAQVSPENARNLAEWILAIEP